ncbi:MAG: YgjV family protein [Clostridiales bacterium]
MLGSSTGVAMNIINMFRSIIFSQRVHKKWADNIIFVYLFIIVFMISGGLTRESIFTIFPTLASIIGMLQI